MLKPTTTVQRAHIQSESINQSDSKSLNSPGMQTQGLTSHFPVVSPVLHFKSDWVATLLLEHLSNKRWACHVDHHVRTNL